MCLFNLGFTYGVVDIATGLLVLEHLIPVTLKNKQNGVFSLLMLFQATTATWHGIFMRCIVAQCGP